MARKKSTASKKRTTKKTTSSIKRSGGGKMDDVSKNIIHATVALVLALAISLGAFDKAGALGSIIYRAMKFLFGHGFVVVPILLIMFGIATIVRREIRLTYWQYIGLAISLLSIVGLVQIVTPNSTAGGGMIGQLVARPILGLFDSILGIIILVIVMMVSMMASLRIGWGDLSAKLGKAASKPARRGGDLSDDDIARRTISSTDDAEPAPQESKRISLRPVEKLIPVGAIRPSTSAEPAEQPKPVREPKITNATGPGEEDDAMDAALASSSQVINKYNAPPLNLLAKSKGKPAAGDIKEAANTIKRTLKNFKIDVEIDEISIGPTVTRFAIKPAEGVKVSKIVGLKNDLGLALAAHPLRIEAPIPGKSLVGIEIPNKAKTTLGLGSLLLDKDMKKSDPLLVPLGKGVSGRTYTCNLAKMPHLMIAGATGSGKSVTVHTIITSLLYRNGPEQLRLIMVDPKRVELTLYNRIPHLLTPVIKQPKKAILALKWATKEMDRRYDLLEKESVRDIGSYHTNIVKPAYANYKEGDEIPEGVELPEKLPYIVIIIDELADIMQMYPKELEAVIVRLAQMSRAVGIHLILSTQRPEVSVITGLIKANVPGRIALRVSSPIDSRTILDKSGAESLLGAGDTLYRGGNMSVPERLQGAYVTEDEVKKVVKYIRKNSDMLPDEINLSEEQLGGTTILSKTLDDNGSDDEDELYPDAKDLVIRAGKASTSYIQRKLRVGYARAARLMDILEDRGIIGPANGSKPRNVLVRPEEDGMANIPEETQTFNDALQHNGSDPSESDQDDD